MKVNTQKHINSLHSSLYTTLIQKQKFPLEILDIVTDYLGMGAAMYAIYPSREKLQRVQRLYFKEAAISPTTFKPVFADRRLLASFQVLVLTFCTIAMLSGLVYFGGSLVSIVRVLGKL